MSVSDYNTDPNSNTSISGINIAEGCPPSGINNAIRQMMADVKTADEANVKLAGAQTISGEKTFTDWMKVKVFCQSTSSGNVVVAGGANIGANDGAKLTLHGKDDSTEPGEFRLLAGNASSYKFLNGSPDGTLTWDGKGFVYDSGDQEITGDIIIKKAQPYLKCQDTSYTRGNGKPSSGAYSGVVWKDNAEKDTARVIAEAYGNTGDKHFALLFQLYDPTSASSSNTRQVLFNWYDAPIYAFEPGSTDQNILLGRSSRKWHEIWCSQSSINSSSDERIKQAISAIPDDVLDAWGDVNWIQYKYNDAVEEKGLDKARLHNGLIAQRVDEAFKVHGLDASKYGLFLYDKWDAQPEHKDDDGNVTMPAQEAGDAYGLRYTEALAMEAAYQRRRADRAEARITAIEQSLNEMEQAIAALAGGA